MTGGSVMKATTRRGPGHWGQTSGSTSNTRRMRWAHRRRRAALRCGSKLTRLGEKQGPGPELVFAFGSFDAFLARRGRSGGSKKPNVSSALGSARSLELETPVYRDVVLAIDGCSGSSWARFAAYKTSESPRAHRSRDKLTGARSMYRATRSSIGCSPAGMRTESSILKPLLLQERSSLMRCSLNKPLSLSKPITR